MLGVLLTPAGWRAIRYAPISILPATAPMLSRSAKRCSCGLACLLIATAGSERLLADGPSFPTTPLRWAQKPEPPQSPPTAPVTSESETHTDVPSGTEAVAHEEQQSAELNLLAANLADAEERHKTHLQEKADWEAKLAQLAAAGLDEPRPHSVPDLDKT